MTVVLQWPWYDLDARRSAERGELSVEETEQLERYMDVAKARHVGQAGVIRFSDAGAIADDEAWPAPPSEEELRQLGGGSSSAVSPASSAASSACQECRERMAPSDVVLTTPHSGAGVVWHPGCFVCRDCGQRLVDMLYFFKDGAYYCGRHFGEKMFPRCAGCDELIFSREYTFAEEQNWHLNHFCCLGCDGELGGERYMVRDESPFCIPCYMRRFARSCSSCRHKIGPDAKRVSHKDLHWHATPECFQCATCTVSIVGKRFLLKGTILFCSPACKDRAKPV